MRNPRMVFRALLPLKCSRLTDHPAQATSPAKLSSTHRPIRISHRPAVLPLGHAARRRHHGRWSLPPIRLGERPPYSAATLASSDHSACRVR